MRSTLLVGSALLLVACEAGPPAPVAERSPRAVTGTGPLALAPPGAWRRLTPSGALHTSPLPLPGGRWVVVSGWRGRGLFAAPAAGGPLVTVQADYLGPRRVAGGEDRVCLEDPDLRLALVADLRRGELGAVNGAECAAPVYDQYSLGLVLHAAPGRTLWHHPRRGQLHLETAAGARLLVQAALGEVRASPDGRHVAYATGPLAESSLHLLEVDTGRITDLGPGAQPAWLPDGSAVLYAVLTAVERRSGTARVTAAELFVADLGDRRPRALTATPGIAEMQPAPSPDGRTVYLADWRGGGIWAATLGREVRP